MMLDEVLRTLEAQKSYSKAGRLVEGKAAARNVAMFNQKLPVAPLDMSKVLSVAEVDGGTGGGGALREVESDVLCSSTRDHPSVALKNAYVSVSEKRNLFDNTLASCVKTPAPATVHQNGRGSRTSLTMGDNSVNNSNNTHYNSRFNTSAVGSGSPSRIGGVSAAGHSLHSNNNNSSSSPPKAHHHTNKTSAFLAIPRERAQRTVPQNPPVGHYNPRYTAIDPAEPNTILPKQMKRKHTSAGGGAKSAVDANGNATQTGDSSPRGLAATPEPRGAPSPQQAQRPSSALDRPTPDVSSLSPREERRKGSNNNGNEKPPPQPTWPFRLPTSRGRSPTRSAIGGDNDSGHRPPSSGGRMSSSTPHPLSLVPIVYNETLITKRQPVLCNMGKSTGRTEAQRTISVDLMYNPPIQKTIKVADVKLGRTTGRDNSHESRPRLARVGREVEREQSRLNTDNYAKFKYKKDPVIADFDKYPSKEVWVNSSLTIKLEQSTHRSELSGVEPKSVNQIKDRAKEISFKKMVPRKDERLSDGFGLSYDVDASSACSLHVPEVNLAKMPERSLNAAPASEGSQVVYNPDVNKFKKRLTQNVTFDASPTREQRALSGRDPPMVFHETHTSLDLATDALALPVTMRPVLKGDPHMSTHSSRARRERALNPPADSHDLMYTYDVDEFRAPLRKGAVAFDQMVSREKHGGSAFANSMRQMVRK